MKAACNGFTTLIITSHLVFLTARQSSHKNKTQYPEISNQKCPGITPKCPGITQLPSIVIRERPLKISRVRRGTTQTSLVMCTLALVSVTQCPGLICRKVMTYVNKQLALLFPLKGKGIVNIEERDVRERERERERREAFIHDARWASQCPGDPSSSSVPAQVTQSGLQDSDPISAMRPAVYYPSESVGNPLTNDDSPFQIDLESGEFSGLRPGLYKPADPAPQHDTWAFSPAAYSSEKGPPSPTRTLAASSSDSRTRTAIVYPLQPRSRQPDVCIQVEASLPEPAALLRPELRQPTREAPTSLPRTHKRLSRKRRRQRSTALYRPAKRSPPRGHWCDV